jgi:hypothetical protein
LSLLVKNSSAFLIRLFNCSYFKKVNTENRDSLPEC